MPILKEGELDFISTSAEQTQRLGARLGALLQPGDVVCLSGEMGAGKTAFAAGVGQGWGAQSPLASPTYTIVHEHHRDADSQRLAHLDCYRLDSAADIDSIGFDDLLESGAALLIEWPEKIEAALPPERLWIRLRTVSDVHRSVHFTPIGARYVQLIAQYRQAVTGA
ncbi:MAG: tRNA (adenosine(37)-N6)-threonylcarbamoyltransferase complex ATPase subunit type 1 TsaE [Anaerolineae bacterium]|nr:tRNA (adenosine(37)-N6)-threonylcarbamoyltransferase complex ATPase subunit type 1 TsaE [Anaerolineae bacterium]